MLSRLSSTILIPFLVFASLLLGALFGYRMGFFAPMKPEGTGWFYEEVFFQINENFVDDIDLDQYKTTGAKSVVESIPHGEYYSIEEAEKESQSFEGRYEGIGIQFSILNDTIFVVNTLRGGPSERLGIQSADRIVEVEGQNVAGAGITQDSVVSLLMGPRNTKVNVSIMRRDSVFPLSIQRGSIATPTVSLSYMADASVGYIKVDMFGAYTHEEFSRAIEKLQQQGMSALLYVRDDFLPKLTTDMSVLQNYWNPDHDLEELRRWELELDNLIREINTRIFQSTKNSSSQDGASLNTAQDDSPNENQSTNEKSQDETLGVNVRNENLDENEEIALRLLLSEPESESGLDSVLGLFEPQEKKEEDSKPIQLSLESSKFWEQVLEEASDPLATCRNIIGGAGSDMSIQLGRILESALDEDPKTFGGKDGVEFIKSLSVWIELGEAIPLQQLQEHSSFEKITEYHIHIAIDSRKFFVFFRHQIINFIEPFH